MTERMTDEAFTEATRRKHPCDALVMDHKRSRASEARLLEEAKAKDERIKALEDALCRTKDVLP